MNEIKVIDLLNMISKGEEVPAYVKYINFVKNKEDIMMVCKENIIYKLDQLEIHLNDKVEIIEEDKKIEMLEYYDNSIMWCMNGREITDNEKDIIDKINEIIDYINGGTNGE